MIRWPKNTFTLSLMISSLVLLFALEYFWLKSRYNEGVENFKSKTALILRSTLMSMEQVVNQRNLDPVGYQSWRPGMPTSNFPEADSVANIFNFKEMTTRVTAFFSPDSTSGKVSTISFPKRSMIRDSLQLDSIKIQYKEALNRDGIGLPFEIERDSSRNNSGRGPDFRRSGQGNRWYYVPVFADADIRMVALSEISPQILFSAFLLIITLGTFFALYRSIRLQQRLMELKNDFISNLTHELKTPVATASVAIEALKSFKGIEDPKRTQEYLEIAQGELGRLTILTDKVLKTAIFEKRGVDFQKDKVDLDKVINEVLKSMKLVFERTETNVSFEKVGADFSLEGGVDHLTNVIYNLIDNALKYRAKAAEIHIKLMESAGKIMVSIRDNGIGISPEYRKKIFEKFFRVPSGNVHNTRGYGLGLSYVSSVVKSHHGSIHVESAPGKGSEFILNFPRKQP